MKKFNYILNGDNTIKAYTIIPFDEAKPYIECDISQIILGHSKVINDELVNDFDFKAKLKELYGDRN